MQGRLLLNIIVAEGSAVLELFAGEDESLLAGADAVSMQEADIRCEERTRVGFPPYLGSWTLQRRWYLRTRLPGNAQACQQVTSPTSGTVYINIPK